MLIIFSYVISYKKSNFLLFSDSSKVSPKFRKVLETKIEEKTPPIIVSAPSLEKSKSDSKLNQVSEIVL
jgi:hypothetical protein